MTSLLTKMDNLDFTRVNIETERLKIHIAGREEMESFISLQTNELLRSAYTQMLDGCIKHPEQWIWYAIWMIELKNGKHIGEICFKGLNNNGTTEIGYGISDEFQNKGYATEAVFSVTQWALKQPNVYRLEAETEPNNKASINVLKKCGFLSTGEFGNEGLRFILDIKM